MKSLRMLTVVVILFLLASCGGGGSRAVEDNNNNNNPPAGDGTGTVKGTVYQPNGVDPVPNAAVYLPDKTTASEKPVPPEKYKLITYTSGDGSFELKNVPAGVQTIKIFVSGFLKSFKITVIKDSVVTVPKSDTTLPASDSGDNIAPNFVVVTGNFDRMQDVLAKIGLGQVDDNGELVLGTEKFDLVDGSNDLPDSKYPEFTTWALNSANFDPAKYHVIFLNCGISDSFTAEDQKTVYTNFKNFVQNGGRIYATDFSYNYVENIAPAAIKFLNDPEDPNTPGSPHAAKEGKNGITVDATIPESQNLLTKYLESVKALTSSGKVHIEGFLGGWVVIDSLGTGTTLWVEGPVEYTGTSAPIVKPLTVTFNLGKGKVLYSSYHTVEENQSKDLRPQERILQFLVFEISN